MISFEIISKNTKKILAKDDKITIKKTKKVLQSSFFAFFFIISTFLLTIIIHEKTRKNVEKVNHEISKENKKFIFRYFNKIKINTLKNKLILKRTTGCIFKIYFIEFLKK